MEPAPADSIGGHVFIVNSDILRICCDCVAISSKGWIHSQTWITPELREAINRNPRSNVSRISHLTKGMDDVLPANAPHIFLIDLGSGGRDIDWFLEGIGSYISTAVGFLKTRAPKYKRAKHLIAIPAFGVRFGGGKAYAGPIVKGILRIAYDAAKRADMDIMLVTNDTTVYQAALACRLREFEFTEVWKEVDIPRQLRRRAEELVGFAQREELVLFLGAGCSVSAGLPQWGQLLEDIANIAGLSEEELDHLWKLNHLDQARILERRLGGQAALNKVVTESIEGNLIAPIHALLQALPGTEIITTNYDTLFEQACKAAGKHISVLPYQDAKGNGHRDKGGKWILKMHGCVTHPEDIVLTREDYIRYNERRQALAGIVQACMITQHMLFIGFSLNDTNFVTIASTVKKALMARTHSVQHFGTALQLIQNPLLDELWQGEITMVNMLNDIPKPAAQDWSAGARKVEIFLDYVVSKSLANATAHLMDPTYTILLSEGEKELAAHLTKFLEELTPKARQTPAWTTKLSKVINQLGGFTPNRGQGQKSLNTAIKQVSAKKGGTKGQWSLNNPTAEMKTATGSATATEPPESSPPESSSPSTPTKNDSEATTNPAATDTTDPASDTDSEDMLIEPIISVDSTEQGSPLPSNDSAPTSPVPPKKQMSSESSPKPIEAKVSSPTESSSDPTSTKNTTTSSSTPTKDSLPPTSTHSVTHSAEAEFSEPATPLAVPPAAPATLTEPSMEPKKTQASPAPKEQASSTALQPAAPVTVDAKPEESGVVTPTPTPTSAVVEVAASVHSKDQTPEPKQNNKPKEAEVPPTTAK